MLRACSSQAGARPTPATRYLEAATYHNALAARRAAAALSFAHPHSLEVATHVVTSSPPVDEVPDAIRERRAPR